MIPSKVMINSWMCTEEQLVQMTISLRGVLTALNTGNTFWGKKPPPSKSLNSGLI